MIMCLGQEQETQKSFSLSGTRTGKSNKFPADWDWKGNPKMLSRCLGTSKAWIPVGKYLGIEIAVHASCTHDT